MYHLPRREAPPMSEGKNSKGRDFGSEGDCGYLGA